jgi:Rhodopirellula transposase DDE domain
MGVDAGFLGRMGPQLQVVLPMLDERARRLVLGMTARAAGDGGTGAVAALTGASWQTVADGAAEVGSGDSAPPGRVRRPGGGRRPLAETDPGLPAALLALVRDSTRGDPQSPLEWTTRSMKHLAGELAGAGHPCSPQTCWRMLKAAGYTMQSNSKAAEGRQHPDRDAQFRYIAAQAKEHRDAGQPVISVDSKKREQVGNYGQDGREWGPQGTPVTVCSHDFPEKDGKHAIPYGIYDEDADAGFVNVGTDGNTAALAVESIRRWWRLAGKDAYPDATRLLVTCDAGGSSGHSNRAWKAGLAELAAETGLEITVCHFPPGTSKWNKIEHRLFCQITLGWRGRPLTSYDVIISTIGAVTTRTGLAVTAVLDENDYPTGLGISDARMKDLEGRALTRHEWHGEWNYTLLAIPRPAPEPGPPARPGPDLDALADPAITGISRDELAAAAAALEVPRAAAREQRLHLNRQGPRRHAPGYRVKLSPAACLLAAIYRYRLGRTTTSIAALLSVDPSTISVVTRQVAALPEAAAILTPPAAGTPPDNTLTTRDTPQTQVDPERCHSAQKRSRS